MTMHVADTLKALITVIISDIPEALTELVRNTIFLFKRQFFPKKEIFCITAGTYKIVNLTPFFLSPLLAPQQAMKGLCHGTGESMPTACA